MVPLQAEARVECAAPTVVDGILLARVLRVRFENLAVPLVLAHLVNQTTDIATIDIRYTVVATQRIIRLRSRSGARLGSGTRGWKKTLLCCVA